ncbi:hypothetical protein LguiB_014288 [Lonicera macranthoides]
MSKLATLAIYENKISGEIPSSIGNLTSLEYLSISENILEGSIPNILGVLKNLTALGIGGNELSGIVPSSIYNLSSLTILSLAVNQLRGSIPHNLGLSLPHLQLLELWGNQFDGAIPVSLTNISDLGRLDLSYNNFIGKVPDFGSLQNLQLLNLDFNILGSREADDMDFFHSLVNCSMLDKFGVDFNQLGGILPHSVGNLSIHLRYFGVGGNRISGVIPSGLEDMGNIQKLQQLYLATNRLSGQIPFSLGNISFLSQLKLENNTLEGNIPSSLGNCQNLILLNLSRNNLNGTIPKKLFSASGLSVSLNLTRNHLVGPILSEVGNLKNLVELDLSENRLSGEIPIELGKCNDLVNLYLVGNLFEGSIPLSFESLKGVQKLDIFSNNLPSIVPIFLANFSLESLNLSFNNFEGELPTNGVFANVSVISIVGNSGLYGGISALQLPRCKTKTSKEQRLSRFHIILISGGCLLLSISMVSLVIICWLKKKKLVQSSTHLPNESFLTVSYGDLLKATDGFSSTNLIGVGSFGSVYKGILDREEKMVAVKVLNLQRQGASKSNDFKALVYEFMPNGSLGRWLHSSQETNNGQDEPHILNFHQRINIAMDVACALEYLHYRCENPIVHCDIKPSNILLDRDMVAHVGDFGLAKFLLPELSNANQSSSIGIRGTIGYVAPEYGLGGEASMNGDLYSYGILLLEMMTGRSPIDPHVQ